MKKASVMQGAKGMVRMPIIKQKIMAKKPASMAKKQNTIGVKKGLNAMKSLRSPPPIKSIPFFLNKKKEMSKQNIR